MKTYIQFCYDESVEEVLDRIHSREIDRRRRAFRWRYRWHRYAGWIGIGGLLPCGFVAGWVTRGL